MSRFFTAARLSNKVLCTGVHSMRFGSSLSKDSSLCKKIAVIGGGQMAEAILNAVIQDKIQSADTIHVYDINKERVKFLSARYGMTAAKSVQECVEGAEIVMLAVKPQNIDDLSAMLTEPVNGMVLSIVAGCPISVLKEKFKTNVVMRTMPNTPSMISEGMTVWTTSPETSDELRKKGEKLLGSIGEQIEVADEKYLDMATAISGSGPAYVFLTMESMIDAAVHMGFPREVATKLVLTTLRGSSSYALQAGSSVHTLKSNVTSPAGTTASALYQLEAGGFRTVVADAVWAAYRKALELGGQSSNVGPGRYKW
mmetsp:Transcript_38796/g.77283  ORF Transcript_38796/g.77283 Transcript_38796/m.77283 type:complete len:312 (+) Transcript_38796:59-994(+)